MRLVIKFAALGLAWVFLAGVDSCSSDDFQPGPTFVVDLQLKNAAGASRQEFAPGEPITLEMTARNRGRTPAILQFSTGQQVDYVVVNGGTSHVRWKWSKGKAFPQGTSELEFAAGETKTFTATWNQVDDNGLPVAVGSYEARGALMFAGFKDSPLESNQLGSPVRAFTIR